MNTRAASIINRIFFIGPASVPVAAILRRTRQHLNTGRLVACWGDKGDWWNIAATG